MSCYSYTPSSLEFWKLAQCLGYRCSTYTNGSGSILDYFPTTVTTCAQAINLLGLFLKNRLGAKKVITFSATNSSYTIKVQLTNSESSCSTITLSVSSNCGFPVTASYVRGASSGSGSFQTMPDLINYLVTVLKQ